ncbi:hypothetical protein [Stomatohabitans albus]|uniref:PPC domain-containing protein n=1 Tax=Stomatohabitans albus TaxID=3110766 RepID=UPI00300D6054
MNDPFSNDANPEAPEPVEPTPNGESQPAGADSAATNPWAQAGHETGEDTQVDTPGTGAPTVPPPSTPPETGAPTQTPFVAPGAEAQTMPGPDPSGSAPGQPMGGGQPFGWTSQPAVGQAPPGQVVGGQYPPSGQGVPGQVPPGGMPPGGMPPGGMPPGQYPPGQPMPYGANPYQPVKKPYRALPWVIFAGVLIVLILLVALFVGVITVFYTSIDDTIANGVSASASATQTAEASPSSGPSDETSPSTTSPSSTVSNTPSSGASTTPSEGSPSNEPSVVPPGEVPPLTTVQGQGRDAAFFREPSEITQSDGGPIAIGESKQGNVTKDQGVAYKIDLKTGQAISIKAENKFLGDTMIWVLGPNGELVGFQDDDEGLTLDSQLRFIAPADGTYTILVADSFTTSQTEFTLTVNE